MNKITFEDAKLNIGKKVSKTAYSRMKGLNINPKPFKSGKLVNTVKDVIEHPTLKIPAYTFEEDTSYVECRRCDVVEGAFAMQDFRERGLLSNEVTTGFLGND